MIACVSENIGYVAPSFRIDVAQAVMSAGTVPVHGVEPAGAGGFEGHGTWPR